MRELEARKASKDPGRGLLIQVPKNVHAYVAINIIMCGIKWDSLWKRSQGLPSSDAPPTFPSRPGGTDARADSFYNFIIAHLSIVTGAGDEDALVGALPKMIII